MATVPDWLAKRDGTLKPGIARNMFFVVLSGAPQYKVEARPAAGAFICSVQQTNNGKRLDDGTAYPTAEAAITGGLEQLKAKLGW
jgi:hypothetical protein